jgi:hypothetical protein
MQPLESFDFKSAYETLRTFFVMISICNFHFRSLEKYTPRSRTRLTFGNIRKERIFVVVIRVFGADVEGGAFKD